jgi:outer membrane lipoprotein carrier protein
MQRREFITTTLALSSLGGLVLAGFPSLLLEQSAFAQTAPPAPVPEPPVPAPPAPATPELVTAASIGKAVQEFYDTAKTYKAEFKQRYWIEAFGSYRDSSGSVVFAKPGKMRWVYSNNGNVVVSNGKELKVYEQENKQMYLQTVDETQYPAALSFLLGNGSLENTFTLELLDAQKLQFAGGYVLMGTPKAATPAYQKILFYIDARTYQVRRALLIDAQRNRNRFDFENAQVNMPLDVNLFAYNPPAGTRVIKP